MRFINKRLPKPAAPWQVWPAAISIKVFAAGLGPSIDAADLYFHGFSLARSWGARIAYRQREGECSIEQGVGVRAMSGRKPDSAYSDKIVLPNWRHRRTRSALNRADRQQRKSGGKGRYP
jgi:hypothetical protein